MTLKKYKVVGSQPIEGQDGKFVAPGETVELDPDSQVVGATNVQALIDGGHIEESSGSKSSTSSTTAKDDKGK